MKRTTAITPRLSRRTFIQATGATLATTSVLNASSTHAGAHAKVPAAAGGIIKVGDFTVRRMGYGAMWLTGEGIWGPTEDPAGAKAVLRRAVELGVNFIDTSDAYGPNTNEEIIAAALYPYPDDLVVATKGGFTRPGPGQWTPDGRPEHLRAACEASLKRLRLETHHVYQLHVPDRKVPLEDTLGELARLKEEGKIQHIGVSNFTLEQLRLAQGLIDVVSVQNRYNVAIRESDPVLAACEQDGIAFIPWGPLGTRTKESDALTKLQEIAGQRGISKYQAALAWLMTRSDAMLPIPGTTSVDHLEENVAAAAMRLNETEMAALG
ncbi:MAG: aldo/keto reductase [Gammaproteobacteria bacterium]|nr:aldo/keto reductase [Gammaproteobacteria bacterium]